MDLSHGKLINRDGRRVLCLYDLYSKQELFCSVGEIEVSKQDWRTIILGSMRSAGTCTRCGGTECTQRRPAPCYHPKGKIYTVYCRRCGSMYAKLKRPDRSMYFYLERPASYARIPKHLPPIHPEAAWRVQRRNTLPNVEDTTGAEPGLNLRGLQRLRDELTRARELQHGIETHQALAQQAAQQARPTELWEPFGYTGTTTTAGLYHPTLTTLTNYYLGEDAEIIEEPTTNVR